MEKAVGLLLLHNCATFVLVQYTRNLTIVYFLEPAATCCVIRVHVRDRSMKAAEVRWISRVVYYTIIRIVIETR